MGAKKVEASRKAARAPEGFGKGEADIRGRRRKGNRN